MSTDMVLHSSSDIFTSDGFATTMKICEALVKSGILPRGIDNPYKAFAIVQKGREIGVGPMRALTGIHLIEGKPVVSPELKLEQFRERGGRVKWLRSDNTVAELWLKAPNGDEHTETVTLADMQTAGVAGKDNWRKYPKSMLRARAVGFGLRALGEGDGSYTPDELGAPVNGEGEYLAPEHPADVDARASYRERMRDEARHGEQLGETESGVPTGASHSAKDSPRAAAPPPPPPPPPSSGGVTSSPKANGASIAVTPPKDAPVTTGRPTTGKRTSGAADIKHDGIGLSPGQNAKIHALRAKSPTLSATPDHPNSKWKQKLAPYKRQDGEPCKHSSELSFAQASHLIDWMQAKADALDAKEREIRSGNDGAAAVVAAVIPPVDLLEALHAEFPTATEEDEWLHSLGYQTADDIPEESRQMVLLLLRSIKQPSAYATNLTKARTLGHVR